MEIIFESIYELIKVGSKYFSLFVNWYILQISTGSLDAELLFQNGFILYRTLLNFTFDFMNLLCKEVVIKYMKTHFVKKL